MTTGKLNSLIPGQHYITRIRGQQRRVRRAFKWTENRFGDIACAVFASRIHPGTTTTAETDATGRRHNCQVANAPTDGMIENKPKTASERRKRLAAAGQ